MPTLSSIQFPTLRNWDELEELSWDLFRGEWRDPNAARHGRQGQTQAGVDIYGRRDGRGHYIGVQCKLHSLGRSLSFDEILDEVSKAEGFQPPLGEFVIATTAPRDAKLQRDIRLLTHKRETAGKFAVHVRFWEDLCSRLAFDLVLAKRHFPQFFVPADTARPMVSARSLPDQDFVRDMTLARGKLQVFVSSRIHGGLDSERRAVADAIEGTGMAVAWYWERDGYASLESYTHICLHHVRESDGLILVVGKDLSRKVLGEYRVARRSGRPCYVFVKEGLQLDLNLSRFLARERRQVATRNFRNLSELRSHVVEALSDEAAQSWRERRALRSRTMTAQAGNILRTGAK